MGVGTEMAKRRLQPDYSHAGSGGPPDEGSTEHESLGERVRRELAKVPKRSEPWVPQEVVVYPVGRSKLTRRRDGDQVPCWDVRWMVDGVQYFKRFTHPKTAADAKEWAASLAVEHRLGWPYDPVKKQFLDPAKHRILDPSKPSVLACALDLFERKWPGWVPSSRSSATRNYSRACRHLVYHPDLRPDEDVDAFLAESFQGPDRRRPLTEAARRGEEWLRTESMAIGEVTWQDLERLLKLYRTSDRSPGKKVSASTEQRFAADLKHLWSDAVARYGISNPWPAVHTLAKGSKKHRVGLLSPVDADLVLSGREVVDLAEACVDHGTWGEEPRAFILTMGFCGLRVGEAMALAIGDVELPKSGPGWVTARRTLRNKSNLKFLDPDELPDYGPLKSRIDGESRTVPIIEPVADALRVHLRTFRAGASPDSLVFVHNGEPIGIDTFDVQVWKPGRRAMFPPNPAYAEGDPRQPKRARLRRHDLRHAACSMWLADGVDLRICQEWSGHRTLSTFLNVYQGIMPGRTELGAKLFNDSRKKTFLGVS
jgi:integrase